MARTETVTRTLYQFDELTESAKETARDWWRGCIECAELTDFDDWQSIAQILGIEFETHTIPLMGGGTRREPIIYWTLNPDSAAFAGRYTYAKGATKRIRAHAPDDAELHQIADSLQSVQRRYFYRLCADCKTGGRDGTSQRIDVFNDNGRMDCDELESPLSDFAHWIAGQLSKQRDWLNSDESIDECIRCNEYEFDESGNIA